MAIYRPHMNITTSFNGPQNIPRGSKTIMSGLFPFKIWEYWKKLRQNGFLELFRGLRALFDRVSNQEIVQRWLWLHLLMTYYGAGMGEVWTPCSSLIAQLLSISLIMVSFWNGCRTRSVCVGGVYSAAVVLFSIAGPTWCCLEGRGLWGASPLLFNISVWDQ